MRMTEPNKHSISQTYVNDLNTFENHAKILSHLTKKKVKTTQLRCVTTTKGSNDIDFYLTDPQTGILSGIPESAICVQRFDDSRNTAIHITYRTSLRSSSMREPRDPLLKVMFFLSFKIHKIF